MNLSGDKKYNIHLIGVAGSGMSGLAGLLLDMGHEVSGSDKVDSNEVARLQEKGLKFSMPHTAEVVQGVDLVIYSSAIKKGNIAYDAAQTSGVKMIRRAEALVEVMRTQRGIVVAGTHGKTTTSAMLSHILRRSEIDSSYYIGAEIPLLGRNARWSARAEYFVAEADESDGSLVRFLPQQALLLNVEEEHLDYYKNIEEIRGTFSTFLDRVEEKIFYCGEDTHARELCQYRNNTISYGWDSPCTYHTKNCRIQRNFSEFAVCKEGMFLGKVILNVPGKHNILNALGAMAVALEVGIPFAKVAEALSSFLGARRRFEVKYASKRYQLVDDYGHHPTEIEQVLDTARSLKPKRIICLFQLHRYTRTQVFEKEFIRVLAGVDSVFLTDIYSAGEKEIPGVHAKNICVALQRLGYRHTYYLSDISTAHIEVGNFLREGDLLITLGAGDIHKVGECLLPDLCNLDHFQDILADGGGDCRMYEPMKEHTTIKIGGPAQYWIVPKTERGFIKVVQYCRAEDIPVRVIGRGSNLLVKDGGIKGVVVCLAQGEFAKVRVQGDTIEAGVGAKLKKLCNVAREAEIGGFEWMEGIPGNVGGALRMNAGAMGHATFDHVVSVRFLDLDGEIKEKRVEEINFQYRNVGEFESRYLLSAVFRGCNAHQKEISKK